MDDLLDAQEKREFCDYEDCVWTENLGVSLQAMRHDRDLTDIMVCAGDNEFPCHRMMLAASSPFFKAMLTGPFREQSREKVDLQDASSPIVELLLDYMYTGRIHITEGNVQEILITANFLLLGRLVDACSDFLRRQLDKENCIEMYSFAEAQGCGELRRATHRYILKNFVLVSALAPFLDAPLSLLRSLLSHENLCVPSEKKVYSCILAWVSHDSDGRQCHLQDLLTLVRMPYLAEETITSMLKEPLITACSSCRDVVQAAIKCRAGFIPYPSEWGSPRRSTNQMRALVVLGGVHSSQRGNSSSSLQHYCCDSSLQPPHWSKQAVMPYLLRNTVMYDVKEFRNAIYVTGGFDGELGALSHVWQYQIEEDGSDLWVRAPSLNTARYQHGSAVAHGQLFVVGGSTGQQSMCDVESYTPDWDQWKTCQPMPEPVTFPAAVGYHERLFVIGGMKADSSPFPWMQCLKVETQTWTTIKTLELNTKGSKSVLLNDAIYILGGPSRTVHVYDPENDTAFDVTPMHDFHVCAGVAVNGGKIFIAGGDNLTERNNWDSIECYDPGTNAWTNYGKLPVPLYWHGLVSIVRNVDQIVPPSIPNLYPLGPSMLFRGYEECPINFDPR